MQSSLPVADRPRRPEWMKVRAPSADSRYFDVKKLIHGQQLHTICEEARCPEPVRVLGSRHGNVPDPRRHLHPCVSLLLRPFRAARAPARSARAFAAGARCLADGAEARGRHVGRPRRRAGPRGRPLCGDDSGAEGAPAAGKHRSADARLSRCRGGGARRRHRRPAGGLQPQHRDGPKAPSKDARRQSIL